MTGEVRMNTLHKQPQITETKIVMSDPTALGVFVMAFLLGQSLIKHPD
jgi:hypothetical protein